MGLSPCYRSLSCRGPQGELKVEARVNLHQRHRSHCGVVVVQRRDFSAAASCGYCHPRGRCCSLVMICPIMHPPNRYRARRCSMARKAHASEHCLPPHENKHPARPDGHRRNQNATHLYLMNISAPSPLPNNHHIHQPWPPPRQRPRATPPSLRPSSSATTRSLPCSASSPSSTMSLPPRRSSTRAG